MSRVILDSVIAHGIDITRIERIRKLSKEDAFVKRVFTEAEAGYATARRDPAMYYARVFAAKEAVMKALGTGWSKEVGWRDIEIIEAGGSPTVRLYNGAESVLSGRAVHLSISCTKEYAVAMAVIE